MAMFNPLTRIRESFGLKIFSIFCISALLMVSVVSAYSIYSQVRMYHEGLLREGESLATLMAYNARLGVFSENPQLLADALKGGTSRGGVVAVAVYGRSGRLLLEQTQKQLAVGQAPGAGDKKAILSEMVQRSAPVWREYPGRIDFWAPVKADPSILSEEEMLFGQTHDGGGPRTIGFVRLALVTTELDRKINALVTKSIVLTLVFLVIGAGFLYLSVRGALRPLDRLTEGVRALEQGGAAPPVDVESRDEIGQVALAFNNMVKALAVREEERNRAEEQIHLLNAELEQRVQRRTAQLEAANQELESFNYSASHDLRAPLTRIEGFCQLLLEEYGEKLDERGLHCIGRLRSTSDQMEQIISAMLDLSRLKNVTVTREPVNLSVLAERILGLLQESAPGRQVRITVEPELLVKGDSRLLSLALDNLLANAWKFSAKKPESVISFGSTTIDGKRTLFVQDNGAGFDMKYADKLLRPFQRLHNAADFPGTGVGLAIVRKVIALHHGTFWLESSEGEGTTAFFSLPETAGT